jgi:hypothetical protein
MVAVFLRIGALAVSDGKEWTATLVSRCLVALMDIVLKPLIVSVILAIVVDFVMFQLVENVLMDFVPVLITASALMVGRVKIAQNVYHCLDV